ncbi:uncharacterized protein LOC123709686 [Pieris brassicae]|uniref:uncharacterized protein LOC123709686 n=2 Tax=Pieris brassicae TaxID=7116 RepID=UPI001E661B90|nr:uncharacterized protein LOC123709686 [Pieris brassicae]
MDKLYQDQLRVWGDIQKLTNNYKKDGADRKRNPDYFQSRLLHLEELWNKFQCNHDRMLIEYSQDHKYFQEMEYEQSQGSYHSIKETLSQAYQDILLRMEKPKASTSVSEFEEQGTSERQESAQQQQGFGINTIKQKGYSQRIKDLLCKQEAFFRSSDHRSIECDIDAITEKWELVAELEEMRSRWDAIYNNHIEIDAELAGTFPEYQEKYYEQGAIYRRKRKEINNKLHSITPNEKLTPRIEIPIFNGSFEKWVSFRDLFEQVIHKNSTLSNAEKMQYLKSKLREEPERLINQLQVSNENYDACWKIITNRYDNKKHILTSYLNSFMQLPKIEKDNLGQIKRLHDVTLECLNGLKNLGICVEHWDTIIVHILSQKLDYDTYQAYIASLKHPKELPVLKDLIDFLEKTFTALETTSNKPQQSLVTKHQYRSNNKPINNKFVSSQVSNRGHDNIVKNTYCKICKTANHVTFNCKSFIAMNHRERLDTVLALQICTNCLCDHEVKDCVSQIRCRVCYQKHNTRLHNALNSSNSPNRPSTNRLQYQNSNYTREHSKRVHTASKDFSEVLLATAKIKVLGVNGKPYLMRALIDQGSQISIISEKAAQLLKLKREGCNGVISGVGENTQRIKGQVTLTCTSIHTNYTLKTRVFIMNNLVHKLPNNSFNMPSWPYIKDIELADPEFNRSSQVDILFGADVYAQIMMSGILRGENLSQPIAQQTRFGWILCGKLKSYQCNIILNNTEDLQKFWEIEDIEESPSVVSSEDQYCLELYKKTTLRQANGKYKVRLPLKDNFKESLGLSKPMAVAQFHSLERKLAKQPKTARQYKDFINEYKDLGHMSFIENKGPEIGYYLPHHCVTREHSETTKLRVVFNGSAKTSTGLSLNDVMYTGPNLQQDLQSLILKWRRFRYVYTADVEKMFRNIDIFECDRKMQRIIWRNSQGRPLQEYELTTVTYGTKAAPFLAMMTLKQLAMDERPRFPRAAEITEQAFYTDDLIYGAHSIEEGCSMVTELQDLLQSGGFTLRKWASNEPRILKEISEKINRDQNQQIFTFKGDLISKTLGVYWNPKEDCFMFQSSFDFSNKTTKRALLSDISKLFDPLGWLAPAITAMKIIFQEVWKQNIKWDDQIPTSILKKWKQFKEEIELSISKIRIPRWLQTSPDSTLELHGFCDASNKAYAAVIYCRINNKVSLVAAKTKLVPVKGKISIPRGELCGAVLLTKLFNKVKACLGYNKIKCYGWTDSMVTLGWIQGQPEKWKPFVSNRVKQIVQDMPSNTWRYVKSEENPADCASRGISVKQLEMHSLWWNGPSWLPLYRNDKETQSYFTKEEEKNQYLVNIVQGTDNTVKGIIQNCSSFSRAIRIVAWILRLLPRNKDKRERYLTLAEVKEAKRKIIRNVQEDDFFYEIEKLRRKESINKSTLIALNPYLGQDGLLRVGGRLRNAFISKDMQHPIIISHTGRLTDLIIDQAHKLTFHGGPRLTLSLIRQKYWILGGNRAVKRQLRLCVTCVKNNPRMQYQIMGDLPEARCNPARPFKHTGVDFTGYILIKSSKGRGIKCTKGYIAVFICMATKAVHLEVVSDLTTSAFLAALKRMAARRGTPEHIYSDNGTNFIGANRVLDSGYDELKRVFAEEQFATTITDMEINWHFNAPAWPSAGGLWEAAVKSLKAHTKKKIRRILIF